MTPFLFTTSIIGALTLAPVIGAAQTTPTPSPFGPPIPGICLFSRDAAISNSKAGQATNARLLELGKGVEAGLQPERAAIVTENTALKAGEKTIPAAQRDTRIAALDRRAAAFNQLQQLRTAQLQQSRGDAVKTILKAIDPLLGPLAAARHCSVVFERGATYGANPAMDLTAALIQQLDTSLPTVTFNLATPESVKR